MRNITNQISQKSRQLLIYIAVAVMVLMSAQAMLLPNQVNAADLTARSLTLSSSAPGGVSDGQNVTYTFDFTAPTSTTVLSVNIDLCTTASGSCDPATPTGVPTGLDTTGAAVGTVTGLGSGGTWTGTFTTNGRLRIANASNTGSPGTVSIQFTGITNPTTANETFFARITTYSDATWSTSIDDGTVAASTAEQITLTGTMDESLVFCSGITITGTNCGTISGSAVTLNDSALSSTVARYGTSVLAASTNGVSGYSITINGSTMTCSACAGSPTIAAMGTQSQNGASAASVPGTAQFGLNLRANDGTPTVGAAIAGTGSGTQGTNYNDNNGYRFYTGDEVALAAGATDANTYTVSYIVNVPGSQAAGTYTSTLTYIATATF